MFFFYPYRHFENLMACHPEWRRGRRCGSGSALPRFTINFSLFAEGQGLHMEYVPYCTCTVPSPETGFLSRGFEALGCSIALP